MRNTRSTFATLRWNTCNIRSKTAEILATYVWNTWKTLVSHCNATSRWNTCNRRMKIPKTLEHMLVTCMYIQHLDLLSQHPDENTCNIRLIQMKHLEHTLETYVYNHCNMCNIPIYFCNIDIKHLQIPLKHQKHLKHTVQHALSTQTSPCYFG